MSSVFTKLETARWLTDCCSRSFFITVLFFCLPIVAAAETLRINDEVLNVRLAVTQAQQMKGLQDVDSLAENEGMLFVFKPARSICMWMKNVPIDLDVGFFDETGKLIAVSRMKAQTEDNHCSPAPAAWALEMKGGWFKRKGIREGDFLRF